MALTLVTNMFQRSLTRRHFLEHLSASAALAVPAASFVHTLRAHAGEMQQRQKAAILLWMGGGPSTIDLFDMKPGAATGGPFRAIRTSGDVEICEHLPLTAKQMHHLAIIRSMSTREADHDRGRYYLHTGYVPNPDIEHPSYGAVVSRELSAQAPHLEIPPFVSIGGPSEGPGFLGMAYAPFVVDSNGQVRNLKNDLDHLRLTQRMEVLAALERGFIDQRRGQVSADHAQVLEKTVALMSSDQMAAFSVDAEPTDVRERYGNTGFGRGCLMARRLVEAGVSFVEVDFGGWDHHQDVFNTLQRKLPELDQGLSALISDLHERGRLADTAVIWMGEFGRTPRINGNTGRDHWARAWSVLLGGAGIRGGRAIGATNADGTDVTSEPFSSEDLMASVLESLGIPLTTVYQSRNGRPMKIANSGRVIRELFT